MPKEPGESRQNNSPEESLELDKKREKAETFLMIFSSTLTNVENDIGMNIDSIPETNPFSIRSQPADEKRLHALETSSSDRAERLEMLRIGLENLKKHLSYLNAERKIFAEELIAKASTYLAGPEK